jgi:hypothetical protein
MEITEKQFMVIAPYLPKQRGNVAADNFTFASGLCILLKIVASGGRSRKSTATGTRYIRFNRWSKNGVITRLFSALQDAGIIEIKTEIVHLDSWAVKVHPDGAGATALRYEF